MKKSFDIEVENEKILKNPRRTRETNQGDLTRNKIMVGLLPVLPPGIFFLLGKSSTTGLDNAPLSLSVSGSRTKEAYTQFQNELGLL